MKKKPTKVKKKAKRTWSQRVFFITALRRVSYLLPNRKVALAHAKVGIGRWKCAICGKHLLKGEYAVDHISPVIPLSGFDNWDGFVARLDCAPEGLQILCKKPCHAAKTKFENSLRRKYAKV
jgi:ribosomal protein L37AE/L43A